MGTILAPYRLSDWILMPPLTAEGQQQINDLAARYGISSATVLTMLEAVMNGGGSMAQFYAPELGGGGQWMRGGMTMVGDMFNHGLKATVDSLCSDLSNLRANQPFRPQTPLSSQSQSGGSQQQSQGGGYGTSVSYDQNYSTSGASLLVPPAPGTSGNWWPAGFGAPNAVGSQNNVRYAYFAGTHRLAVEVNGTLGVYDTLDHNIGGFSQQQGSGGSITFTSQYGTVNLASLPQLTFSRTGDPESPAAPAPPAAAPVADPCFDAGGAGGNAIPSSIGNSSGGTASADLIATLERLGDLNKKGFITDAEFQAKKAELLARI